MGRAKALRNMFLDFASLEISFLTLSGWDAALWVKNATDEAYATLSAAPLAYSGTEAYFLEAPRTWGATVRYNF